MTSKRHKVKNREPDTYPSCILCGKGDLGPYTLQVVQAGGEEPVWTHGHCYAEVHATFATESLEEAKTLLRKAKCDARGAVKCLELAMRELRSAKDCLVGKALWPDPVLTTFAGTRAELGSPSSSRWYPARVRLRTP